MTEEMTMILNEISGLSARFEERFDRVDERFDKVDERLDGMEGTIRSLDYRVSDMERRMDDSELNQTKTRMILENDVLKSINIIAEGHLDLNRKLDEAL